MVRTFFILVLILLFVNDTLSQINFTGCEKLYNKAEYSKGNEKIIEFLFHNIQFPTELLTEPTVSVMIGVVEISPEGRVSRVFSLNDTEAFFINEFRRQISRIEESWNANGTDTSYFIIPIEFRNVPEDFCQPEYLDKPDFINNPIVCILDMPAIGFLNDTIHMKNYEDLLYEHKYSRSMSELTLLINRQPFNKELYLKKIRLLTYSGEIENARIEELKARLLFNNQLEDKSRTTIDEQ